MAGVSDIFVSRDIRILESSKHHDAVALSRIKLEKLHSLLFDIQYHYLDGLDHVIRRNITSHLAYNQMPRLGIDSRQLYLTPVLLDLDLRCTFCATASSSLIISKMAVVLRADAIVPGGLVQSCADFLDYFRPSSKEQDELNGQEPPRKRQRRSKKPTPVHLIADPSEAVLLSSATIHLVGIPFSYS